MSKNTILDIKQVLRTAHCEVVTSSLLVWHNLEDIFFHLGKELHLFTMHIRGITPTQELMSSFSRSDSNHVGIYPHRDEHKTEMGEINEK